MAGHAIRRDLLDLLSDELAHRSGLLLSVREVRDVAIHVPDESLRNVLLGDLDGLVFRATDIYADLARGLRVAIGNLPDDQPAFLRGIEHTHAVLAAGYDPGRIMIEF